MKSPIRVYVFAFIAIGIGYCSLVYLFRDGVSLRGSNSIAEYEAYSLTLGNQEYFSFTAESNEAANHLRFQMPNGKIFGWKTISQDDIAEFFVDETAITDPKSNEKKIVLSSGFNKFFFSNGQLKMVSLHETSGVKIDFGNGVFWELPISRKKLTASVGPPKAWRTQVRGMP